MARMDSDDLLPSHLDGFFLKPFSHLSHEPDERELEKLTDIENQVILKALESNEGNKALTARVLGISRATLYRKLRTLAGDLR